MATAHDTESTREPAGAPPTPPPPSLRQPGEPVRLSVTLDGEYADEFLAELARGGGPDEVIRRFMDRARPRSIQVARHDVRGELYVIRTNMEIMKLKTQDPDLLEVADDVVQACDRANRTLSQMTGI